MYHIFVFMNTYLVIHTHKSSVFLSVRCDVVDVHQPKTKQILFMCMYVLFGDRVEKAVRGVWNGMTRMEGEMLQGTSFHRYYWIFHVKEYLVLDDWVCPPAYLSHHKLVFTRPKETNLRTNHFFHINFFLRLDTVQCISIFYLHAL